MLIYLFIYLNAYALYKAIRTTPVSKYGCHVPNADCVNVAREEQITPLVCEKTPDGLLQYNG